MRIGIVVHNLQLIDSPQIVRDILSSLSEKNCIDARLCGTLGKIAAIDAGLEDLIDISQTLKPSACIEALFRTNDLVCLLNHGKELNSGRTFGRIVVSNLKNPEEKPLLQIERPGSSDGEIIPWNPEAYTYAEKFSSLLDLKISQAPEPVNNIEITNGGQCIMRRISALPGAYIMVNGIVIGKATSYDVTLISENGFLALMEGGVVKEEGIKILHRHEEKIPVDLSRAWIKTGNSRKNSPGNSEKTDPLKKHAFEENPHGNGATINENIVKAVLVDHCAERSLEMIDGTGFAVTIGDDTTEMAGNIFYRFGIPVLGITDGDCDELASTVAYYPGSLVLQLKPGGDDEFGRKVRQELFSGSSEALFESREVLKQRVIKLAGNSLESVSEF
jgi:hypothetical protein